jgi:hypothetical protein
LALLLWRQLFLNFSANFGDQPISTLWGDILGGYRLANIYLNELRANFEPLFGQNRKSSTDAHRNDGTLGFNCKVKAALLKGLKFTV